MLTTGKESIADINADFSTKLAHCQLAESRVLNESQSSYVLVTKRARALFSEGSDR